MEIKNNFSVNIVRDYDKQLQYYTSSNTVSIAQNILKDYHNGIHCFNIVGSYGTGKSSFLWAFNKSLNKDDDRNFLNFSSTQKRKIKTINIVGEYSSITDFFKDLFGIDIDKGNQQVFNTIEHEYQYIKGDNGILLINIDEFGKFLEYASKNNPEKEMYFIQQLAEFVNDNNNDILLLTAIHQGFGNYSYKLPPIQQNEWKKVQGRFKEILFNVPIENLLLLASKYLNGKNLTNKSKKHIDTLLGLNELKSIFNINKDFLIENEYNLFPLDIFSGTILTKALQKYGQNERSLFTFLNNTDHLGLQDLEKNEFFDIANVYDYLFLNLYGIINSKFNPDYSQWTLINDKLEEVEVKILENLPIAKKLIKTLGLLNIFALKGAKIDQDFLLKYFRHSNKLDITNTIQNLESQRLIKFSSYYESYKLIGGTDFDIEKEIAQIAMDAETPVNIVHAIKNSFEFPILNAYKYQFETGTPRVFEFKISEDILIKTPQNEIDGYINLIFNDNLTKDEIVDKTRNLGLPIIYAHYTNTIFIKDVLMDISRSKEVLKKVDKYDYVALKELREIINNQNKKLTRLVYDDMFSNYTYWYYDGREISLRGKKELTIFLSHVCRKVYYATPKINMELINKHKVSGTISSSRKSLFKHLVENWDQKDLGYTENKFPADKTIYWTLLKETGIHRIEDGEFTIGAPTRGENFLKIWEYFLEFLKNSRKMEQPILDLIQGLKQKPYKLKQGVVDFIVPIFLFVKRGDFALYNTDTGYIPFIDDSVLYLLTRVPQEFSVRAFELDNLRLNLFHKYREFLNQEANAKISNESFIESIRPFLILYNQLTEYGKKTKTLSKEAVDIRKAISHATDPEKVFFKDFPLALGTDISELLKADGNFDDYINKLQLVIQEIKNSYDNLLWRVETFIQSELVGTDEPFPHYKNVLIKRYENLKRHQLHPQQVRIIDRINSPLEDRESWLNSVVSGIMNKSLDKFKDSEEKALKERLIFTFQEMDNLVDIENATKSNNENVYKLDFTSYEGGRKKHLIRVLDKDKILIEEYIARLENNLIQDKQKRIVILTELLKKELNDKG